MPSLTLLLPGARLARTSRRGPSVGDGLGMVVGLPASAVVHFTVLREVYRHGHRSWIRVPGSFSIAGHRGLNRLRFSGRVSGLPLPPGRYLLAAKLASGPGQAAVFRITP